MKLFSKESLISEIKNISSLGWHKSVKKTIDFRNDGAVGNTLEKLLGINENNLPIPNANEWELKGQRKSSTALITLKHIEPSPIASKIVSKLLLPMYGWKHKQAGKKYSLNEMSFRSTTNAMNYTNRGFRIFVDRIENKIKFVFNSHEAAIENPKIQEWMSSVDKRIGLGSLIPEPYWGFDDLKYSIGTKIKNCFYVIADNKTINNHEYFHYQHLYILSKFSFDMFLDAIEKGIILIDFDARTGHNHGTKFRMRQNSWTELYENVDKVF